MHQQITCKEIKGGRGDLKGNLPENPRQITGWGDAMAEIVYSSRTAPPRNHLQGILRYLSAGWGIKWSSIYIMKHLNGASEGSDYQATDDLHCYDLIMLISCIHTSVITFWQNDRRFVEMESVVWLQVIGILMMRANYIKFFTLLRSIGDKKEILLLVYIIWRSRYRKTQNGI